jgi:MFS transporter, DHA1 family, multidrug resistance protein
MKKQLIVYLVSFVAFLGPFTQSIYTPMLPEIQNQFQASPFVVNLTISIFTLVLALMQIVYGPLVDRKGRRKILLPCILIYVTASLGAALSTSIWILVFFRALQAVGIAAGSVVATTVIGDLFEGKQVGRAMGTFQMLVMFGPVVGPVIGGIVGEFAGFHGVFWVLTAIGLWMWAANTRLLPETKPQTGGSSDFGWKSFAEVFSERTGAAVVMLGFIQYYTMYNFIVFLPHILSDLYGLSASQKGVAFLPMSLCLVSGGYIGGRLQEKFDSRKLLIATASLNVFATLLFVIGSSVSLLTALVITALFGVCLGLSAPVQTTLLANKFRQNRATAMGVYNFFRYLGMAAGPMVGALLYPLGNQMEFLFAALVFAFTVVFASRQFFLVRKESVM